MRNGGSALLFMCFCLLGLAAMRAQAANGAWISTGDGASGYWTNHANWSASPYPGNGNTAALTNAAAGAYTAILDNSIATLTTLNLSNTAGQAWLVVTQGAAEAALVVTTINMDQGGRIRIESGGSVTNTSSTGINPLGDATIQINNQGRLVSSAGLTIGSSVTATGRQLRVVGNGVSGGAWDLNNQSLNVGSFSGNSAGTFGDNRLIVSNTFLQSVNGVTLGYNAWNGGASIPAGNELWLLNVSVTNAGALTMAPSGGANKSRDNRVWVDGGSFTNAGATSIGMATYATNNSFLATGGADVNFGNGVYVGGGSTAPFNSLIVTGNLSSLGGYGAFYVGGGAGFGNTGIVQGASDRAWNGASSGLYVGNANGLNTTAYDNYLALLGGTWTNFASVRVGYINYGSATWFNGNTLLISNAVFQVGANGAIVGYNAYNSGGHFSNNLLRSVNTQFRNDGPLSIGLPVGANVIGVYNRVQVEGGSFTNSGAVSIGTSGYATNNIFLAAGGADVYFGNGVYVGGSASAPYNSLIVTGNLSSLGGYGAIYVGGSAGIGNTGIVQGASGRAWNGASSNLLVGNGGAAYGNYLSLLDGTWTNFAAVRIGNISSGSGTWNGNALLMSNAAFQVGANGIIVGYNAWNGGAGFTNNLLHSIHTQFRNDGALNIGSTVGNGVVGAYNRVRIEGGVWTNAGAVMVGYSNANPMTNSLTLSNGAQFYAGGSATVGGNANAKGNVIEVYSGSLFEATNFSVNANNYVTNNGGIYQFTTNAPTIPVSGMSLQDGTISFRDVDNANIKTNWSGTSLARISYGGVNTFRLNNSTNNSTMDQSYWFDMDRGATNYAGLEMVGGNTGYTNGSVTVGTNGWLTFSNTTATMWGAVTNFGTINIHNSAVTFKTNVVLQSGGTIDITSTNSLPMAVNGTLTLAPTVVNLPADLGTRDSLTLFLSSDSDISGTVSGWACVPATHTARVVGRAVVIQPWGGGTAIYFR